MAYEWFIARRYLRPRGGGFVSVITFISMAGVAVGVAALIIAQALMTGFYQGMRAKILSGNADLMVWNAEPGAPLEDPGTVLARLQPVSGIHATSPVVLGNGLAIGVGGREPTGVEIFGVDPERESAVSAVAGKMVLGRLQDLTPDNGGIVLGAELARSLGVTVGDHVRLVIPQIRISPLTPAMARNRLFEVVGIFALDFYMWDAGRAYLHIDEARSFLSRAGPGQVTALQIRLHPDKSLAGVREATEAAVGAEYFVGDVMERNDDFFRAMQTERVYMFLAIGLIIMVACLNIVSTLTFIVMEKVRAIGALVALGATVRGIIAIFMIQGMVIGVVGTVAGIALGTGLAWTFDTYTVIKLNPEIYFIPHVPFKMGVSDIALAAGLALLVSFVATLYPALRAARLRPVEALRHE